MIACDDDGPMNPMAFALNCRCGKAKCETHEQRKANEGRVVLPPTIEPVHYDLALTLHFETFTFDGEVAIDIDVKQAGLKSVTLHARDLAFVAGAAEFKGIGQSTAVALDAKAGTATFSFDEAFPVGVGMLTIKYIGELNDQMCGLYRSKYTDVHGNEKIMACTQFESIDARRCLPCWDEPRRKATFTTSMRVPAHMVALSNMPEASTQSHTDGTKTISYMKTPRMSTYLLAFVVGEFDHLSGITKNGVIIRVFCPPGKPHLGRFALDCAIAALDRYDSLFGITYPLPKSDMVAIPEFAAGAMENWGLVTYREVDLLIDDKNAASKQLQRVAEVVIHELAHQWFGNLVTMEWWDDLWLNEGFATWMETGVCDDLHPDWSMWEQFITDMQGHALALDAQRTSHPIQVPIGEAEEVEQVFDAISYCKGGSVIRMVHAVVGEEAFLKGLSSYMANFKYGNATTDDLWAAWENASGKPITLIMGQWTRQMGFPLIELKKVVPDGKGNQTLTLSQAWFLADGSTPDASDGTPLWTVPLFAQCSGSADVASALMPAQPTFEVTVKGDGGWVKLNAGQHVPLRVKYPDDMITHLADAVRAKAMPAADRIGLLSDHAALAKAGRLDPCKYLELLSAYTNETDATVWSMVIEQLLGYSSLLTSEPALRQPFDAFARSLLLPKLAEVGWTPLETDGHLTRKLRGELISALPTFCATDKAVYAEARRRFDAFVADPECSELPSEYQQAVYKIVLKNGGDAEFEALISLLPKLPLNEMKKCVLVGLGAAPTPKLRTRALELALSETVKLQDIMYIGLSMHGASAEGQAATWDFFTSRRAQYEERLRKAASSMMDAVIASSCRGFATEQRAAEVKAHFEASPMPRNERKIAQTLEAINTAAKYLSAVKASNAAAWLSAQAK